MEGSRNYTIRLYRAHDYDLISLMLIHDFDVRKGIYIALKNFCKNKRVIFETLPAKHSMPTDVNWIYRLSLFADAENDEDIITLLSKVKSGCRNSFMKGLLRLYLCNPVPNIFLETESDADDIGKMLDRTFKTNVKVIDAENMSITKADRKRLLTQTEGEKQKRPDKRNNEDDLHLKQDSEGTLELNSKVHQSNKQKVENSDDLMDLFTEMTGM